VARGDARAPHAHDVVTARGLHVRWCGGALTGGSVVARRRQSVAGEQEGEGGTHRGGRATVGRWKAAGAAVFNGGGVAPVVIDMRGGVLQHQCGRGKRDLAPIRVMVNLGGRSPERGKTAAVLSKI
jgi:hypothetical protein